MCFPYLARDKWWDRDFENCFGIRPVTTIRKMWVQSKTWRQWLKIGVLQGSKTTSAFCKLRLPNFAQDESSNHDSENCFEISAVTRFRICLELLHFPTFMFFTPPYCTAVYTITTIKKFSFLGSCLNSMKWCRRWKSIKRNHETCRTDQESKTARNKKRCFLFGLRLFLSKSQKEEGISRPIGVF